jgi:hypothetical protein
MSRVKPLDVLTVDAHGLKIEGWRYLMFFAKIPRGGGQRFQEKLPGGSPYFGFYCIFINKCFEFCLRGVLYLHSPLPPPHPPFVHLWLMLSIVHCVQISWYLDLTNSVTSFG